MKRFNTLTIKDRLNRSPIEVGAKEPIQQEQLRSGHEHYVEDTMGQHNPV